MRSVLRCAAFLAAAPSLLLLAAPAYAAEPLPDCAVALVNAAAGDSRTCLTSGLPPMANRNVGPYRSFYVAAQSGTASVTVSCPYVLVGTTVTAPQVRSGGDWSDDPCRLTLTALADGTTAEAGSFGSYVISLD